MTKAKKFIQNYKRDYSNTNVGWNDNGEEVTWYSPWLSPDDALRAVEIELINGTTIIPKSNSVTNIIKTIFGDRLDSWSYNEVKEPTTEFDKIKPKQ